LWDNYHHRNVVFDKRRKAGFLGDKDFNFGQPPQPRRELTLRLRTLPPPSAPMLDDSDDFVANVFHTIQMARQEGRKIELVEELTEDEATRLALLMSEMPPPMPRYAVNIMPPGLSEEEAFNLALQDSVPPPTPPLPSWAPAPAPPPPSVAPAFALPLPDLVDLTQVANEGEE
jgi:hypothetical protein